jgi:BMFP domain-containing protein YqiC
MVIRLCKKWLGEINFLIYNNKKIMEKIRKIVDNMIKATKKGDVDLELKFRAQLSKEISTYLKK